MRGRDIYSAFKPHIDLIVVLLQIVPRGVVDTLLACFRHTPGKVGFAVRYLLVRRLASRCGDVVAIYPGVYFLNIERLEIGDHVSIHQMCYLECVGGLRIGSNVSISHGVSIITHEHDYVQLDLPIREAPLLLRPVEIENNVWLGAGARILAGVSIGSGVVIGAGAVVTKPIMPNSVAIGVPARVVAMRENKDVASG